MVFLLRKINQSLTQIKQSEYARNLSVTGLGVGITAVLGLITSPILSRLFTPEAYGVAGLYSTTLIFLEQLATLMLPAAIVVARGKRELYRLIGAVKYLLLIAFGLCLGSVIAFKSPIQRLFNDDSDGYWLYLLPFGLLGAGIVTLTINLNIRGKRFKSNAQAHVYSNVFSRMAGLLGGWLAQGYYLVIVLAALLAVFPRLAVENRRQLWQIISIPPYPNYLRATLRHFKDYPLYILPGNLLGSFSGRAPFFVFSIAYNPQIAGLYLFANGMLQIPVLFLQRTIEPVYLQKITDLLGHNPERFRRVTRLTNYALFALGLVPFAVLTVFGQEVFAWVFSARWTQAGLMAQYLSIVFLFRMSGWTLSPIYRVTQRERSSFVTQLLLFALRLGPLLIGLLYFELETALLLFAIGGTLGYLFHFYQMMRIAGLPFLQPVLIQLAAFGGLTGALFWVKHYLMLWEISN